MRRIIRILLTTVFILLSFSQYFSGQTTKNFRGSASYYADRFHGRRMSNGQRYHRDSMTCAHLTLPFGTLLRVHNPQNDSSVIVKVTDRGPYSRRHIIDLSRAAAKKLDIIHRGHAIVNISVYEPHQVPYHYQIQSQLPPATIHYNLVDTLWHEPVLQLPPLDLSTLDS